MFITIWNIQNKPLGLFCTRKNSTVTAPAIFSKIGQGIGCRLVWKDNKVRVELISIKMHSETDYPSVTHADCGFTDQASRIAGVIRLD